MTKSLTSILLIFTSLTVTLGQEFDDSCEEAIARANEDFGNGIMKATSYGLTFAADPEFEGFYDEYLLDRYGVINANGGCFVTEGEECYSSRMFALIEQKYGQDFFKRARAEAEKLYPKKRKTFDDEAEEDIELADSDAPYILVDVQPEFPGGLDQLYKYLGKELRERKILQDSAASRIYVQFVINSTGSVKEVEVVKGTNPKLNSALIDIFQKMPRWTPGLRQNENVNTKLIIPFSY